MLLALTPECVTVVQRRLARAQGDQEKLIRGIVNRNDDAIAKLKEQLGLLPNVDLDEILPLIVLRIEQADLGKVRRRLATEIQAAVSLNESEIAKEKMDELAKLL